MSFTFTRFALGFAGLCLGMGTAGIAANAADDSSPLAARIEGYLGAALLDGSGPEPTAFAGGGVGSAVLRLLPFVAQVDVFGDRANYNFGLEGINNTGFGLHLGLRDPELGAVAFSGAWDRFEFERFDQNVDAFRIGGEGELYLGIFTLGASAGVLEYEDVQDDDYYVRGSASIYPVEDLKLQLLGGVVDSAGSSATAIARAELEYRLPNTPVSLLSRWEGSFDSPSDSHEIVAGIRVYFDRASSLRASDRGTFFDGCTLVHSVARSC